MIVWIGTGGACLLLRGRTARINLEYTFQVPRGLEQYKNPRPRARIFFRPQTTMRVRIK
jgi:hypothetical protein